MDYITVYDRNLKVAGFLEYADEVEYELKLNDISTAGLKLPVNDPQNALLVPRAYVRIPDGERDLGLFRVISAPEAEYKRGGWTEYRLEHVCATLMDDCIPGFLTLGGTGMNTAAVITALLARQTNARWVLGECDFTDQFEYTFENTDLLSAVFSIGNVLAEDYTWVWDTSTTPWRVSLKKASAAPKSLLLYSRNLVSVTKSMDATSQFTRIYPRGSGEGDNQVNIKSVNNGIDYLDATPQGADVISAVYADNSIEDPTLLKAAAQRILEQYSQPYYTYEVDAIDYSLESGQRFDRHMPGDSVRVLDSEDGVELTTRVVSVGKKNVNGDPGSVTVTLSNRERDASREMAEISSRLSVTELYSQGATNLYSQQYADNAGPDAPGTMRFYIPSECVRINKVLLSWRMRPFRAYSRGAAASGQISVSTTLGGETTLSGGGTTSNNALVYTGPPTGVGYTGETGEATGNTGEKAADVTSTEAAGAGEPHNHQIPAHSHSLNNHTHTVPSHVHYTEHWHTVPDHMHELAGHTHAVEVSAHTHPNVYGIYTGTTGSIATLTVDGVECIVDESSGSEVDITQWLEMSNGRIRRGTWHEIEITPDKLTRIEINLFVQLFVQSRGGGDY